MRFALFSSVSFLFLAALPVTAQAAFEFVPPPQQTAPAVAATAPEVPTINNEPVRAEALAPAPTLAPIAAPTPPPSMAAPEAPAELGAPMELGRKAIPLTPVAKESDALSIDDSMPSAPPANNQVGDQLPPMTAEPMKPAAPSFGSEDIVEAPHRTPPRNAAVSTEDLLWDNEAMHTGRGKTAAAANYGDAELPTTLSPVTKTRAVDSFAAPLPPLMPAPKALPMQQASRDVIESDIPSVPAAPAPSAYASELDEGAPVQGFGRQVPLAMALQQIVPPSYRYSFDHGVDPGMRVSWTGGKPWKAIITDLARQNGLNVDIVTNVVAFRRNSPMDIVSADSAVDTSSDTVLGMKLKPVAGLHDPATDPMLLPQDTQPIAPSMPAPMMTSAETAAAPVVPPVVATKPAKTMRPNDKAKFDALLDSDVAAGARVKDKRIIVADDEKMVQDPDDFPPRQNKPEEKKTLLASTSETKKADEASPMNIVPPSSGQETKTDMPSVANPPVKDEWMTPLSTDAIAAAPAMSARAIVPADLTSVVEWEGYKNQTLRETLMAWSQRAGVSVVWSSEYDYPLQTDVRVQANYGDAVRTLLAGFSKAQPRPIGRFFKNDKVGAQPVLVIETQRLTN